MIYKKFSLKDVDKKVFLILDNLKVHHGKTVQAWLNENETRIGVFYLPPYAPGRNPDEYLNHCLKQDVHTGILPHTAKEIKHEVKALFKHKNLKYIAA